MRKKGFFITFEGTDGVGKSTQLRLLTNWIQILNLPILITREPGGGAVSERIRQLLLDPAVQMEGLTELFLYQAARVEHVNKVLRPALSKNKIVICDRYTDATLAYQGYARGLLTQAKLLNQIATNGLKPDLTILLDHPPQKALNKAKKLKGNSDRLENEGIKFQKSVHSGYLQIAKSDPKRIKIVEVQASIEKTQLLIQEIVKRSLRGYFGATPSHSLFKRRT